MTEAEQNCFKSIMTQVNCVYVYQNGGSRKNGSDYFKSSFHWGRKTRIFSRNHWEENCFFSSSVFQISKTLQLGITNYCSDTHFSGEGGTIYSTEFFLFSQFWPTDIFIVENCQWYH